MMEPIVHICTKQEWISAGKTGVYRTVMQDIDGFIHFSRVQQVLKVANHYYSDSKNLVLLWIDPRKLVSELRWEESDGDIFPHLYGPLNLDAVTGAVDFPPDPDGIFRTIAAP